MDLGIPAPQAFRQWVGLNPSLMAQCRQEVRRAGIVEPSGKIADTPSTVQPGSTVGSGFNHLIRRLNLLTPVQELSAVGQPNLQRRRQTFDVGIQAG